MAAWANWAYQPLLPGMEALKSAQAAQLLAENGPQDASMCDAETRWQLRQWVEAKRTKDYPTADAVHVQLRAKRVDPNRVCPKETFAEWAPLIMNAQPPAPKQPMFQQGGNGRKRPLRETIPYEVLDEGTKKEIDQWMKLMQKKDFQTANNMRDMFHARGVAPETIMAQTDWLKTVDKKYRLSTWVGPEEPSGPIPKVYRLSLPATSRLSQEGFIDALPAIVYRKEQEVFSEAHSILQDFWEEEGIGDMCTFQHDGDGLMNPEVQEALTAIGHGDSGMTIVTCPSMSKAAVGIGGKKMAERAAKLAMAVALAGTHPRTEHAANLYPSFAQVLKAEEDLQSGVKRASKWS